VSTRDARPRNRLPIAPERPERAPASEHARSAAQPLASDRIVLAVSGHESLSIELVQQVLAAAREHSSVGVVTSLSPHAGTPSVFRAAGACAALATDDSFVGGQAGDVLKAWLSELPHDAWVITVGRDACALIAPTFSVGLGKRHEMAAAATDLWLGQSSVLTAAALAHALCTR
jgi:hypothetical protein